MDKKATEKELITDVETGPYEPIPRAKPKNGKERTLDMIIESMLNYMSDGGMDTSYSGHYYEKAKEQAIKEIISLFNPNS